MKTPKQSSYEILGIDLNANNAGIRKRYFELVRKYPPEKSPDEFMKIRQAYDDIIKMEYNTKDFILYKQPVEYFNQLREKQSEKNTYKKDILTEVFEVPFSVATELKQLITPLEIKQ